MIDLFAKLDFQGILYLISIFVFISSLWMMLAMGLYLIAYNRKNTIRFRLNNDLGTKSNLDDERLSKLWINEKHIGTGSSPTKGFHPFTFLRQVFTNWARTKALVGGMLLVSFFLFSILWMLSNDFLISISLTLLFLFSIKQKIEKRGKAQSLLLERQLAEALELISHSLQAGHNVVAAFEIISDEMELPISDVFHDIVKQNELGMSLEDSITYTASRSTSDDLKLFAASTTVQLRTGGNLTYVTIRLKEVILDRIRLRAKIRVLTTESKFSKNILIALPLLCFALLYLFNRDYLAPLLETSIGHYMLFSAFCMLVIGDKLINKITELKY